MAVKVIQFGPRNIQKIPNFDRNKHEVIRFSKITINSNYCLHNIAKAIAKLLK